MALDGTNVKRWAGLFITLLGIILTYWSMSFNVIAIPLKETFNYTQSQVELVSSLSTAGFALSFLEAVISSKFGYLVSYVLGWLISPAALGTLYVAVLYKSFFTNWPVLLGLFQSVTVFGNSFLIMRFVNIGVNNFSKKHTGKIIGVYTAFGAASKFFYAGMFQVFFKNDFASFLLTVSAIWITVYGVCIFIHRPIPLTDIEKAADPQCENGKKLKTEASQEYSVKDVLKTPQFHVLLWSASFVYGSAFSTLNNITLIGQSAGIHEPLNLVYVLSSVNVFSRLTVGIIYDKLPSNTARYGMLLVYYLILISGLLLGMVWFTKPTIILVAVLVGIAIGCGYVLPIAAIVTKFGRKHYSLVSGLFHVLLAVFVTFIQTFIGLFYGNETGNEMSENGCLGPYCFFWSFAFLLSLCCFSVLLLLTSFCFENSDR